MATVNVAELVLDWSLYPRQEVDGMQVGRLVEAIQAGESLPPMVVDEKSLRVVDGFHRLHAYQRAKAEKVRVNLRSYANDPEMFLEAVRLNARHGVPLSPQDQARTLILADHLEITREAVASALAVRLTRLEAIVRRKLGNVRGRGPIYLKPAVRHYAGGEVPGAVADANENLGGNTGAFYVRQLLLLIRSGGLLIDDEMRGLLDQLGEAVGKLKTAA